MGETEARVGKGMRSDLRHDNHTVSLLTDHLVFSPKYRGKVRDRFQHLKEWCPDHLWAPSCYHKTFKKSFIKNASQSVGQGWEVVEKYIEGQKGYYENIDTVPVVVVDEEKKKALKIGYITLYTNFLRLQAPYLKYGVWGFNMGVCAKRKKPWFKKSEMRGDLPFTKGTVVSASERRGGAL